MTPIYLDHAATTPLDPSVLEAMLVAMRAGYGNPSAVHGPGRAARLALETARESIAADLNVAPGEICFTSGGTESDNLALRGALDARKASDGRDHLVTVATEHHAVLHTAEALRADGFPVTILPVDRLGRLDLDELRRAVTGRTALVSIMHANNEIGTVHPIPEIARIIHEMGAWLHTDAVQSIGKLPVDVQSLGADLVSFTAHKLHGPVGTGALIVRSGVRLAPQQTGGAHERSLRAGTESVAGAVGLAAALHLSLTTLPETAERLARLSNKLRTELLNRVPDLLVNGDPEARLPGIVSVSLDAKGGDLDGEMLLMGLDLAGVAASAGSACASGSVRPSHVLLALGHDEPTARASIRFSLGRDTTEAEIDGAALAFSRVAKRIRR